MGPDNIRRDCDGDSVQMGLLTLYAIAGWGAAGVAAPLLLSVGAAAAVPWAMSTFGTVVSGVGTLHAAGGVAATLQAGSAALWSASAAAVGGSVGGALGGALGVAAPLFASMGAAAAVPAAMSYFGTVVSGVGTLHAAGGIAATLQATSVALGSSSALLYGGAVGAVSGVFAGAWTPVES
ncbi:hypothetical protein SDRG_14129 [Saprolegnia diclina VS20]|uniref:Uncharacterized protein n=1 Tax=Saprolegnia diclina (strain VS20) TaxID=1156394 RepID=T0R7J5_SAPDV|nr:hypothetical protein SDRG_14129 [Saprolegnia diclina VS20]EQC28033.1 hypothetical protein SDRG_14129 [Saprolegnia diclina VS20]|eukprot:XP_008618458.1 hypothetical protein SDRG_14129 [Saprolegnia diclina VS20]